MSPDAGRNNFDGVRIGLALIVVFAHLAVLTARPEFSAFGPVFDSDFAVKGFFAISGFLVTRSCLASASLFEYAEKRVRRIWPAYLTAVLLCLMVGVASTRLGLAEFFASPSTWKYLAANAVFLNFLQPTLPGALEANPMPALNGALWTIKVEVMLYACVPPMLWLFARAGARTVTALLVPASIAWVFYFGHLYPGALGPELSRQFPGQLSYFALGALLAVDPALLARLRWIAPAALIGLVLAGSSLARLAVEPLAYAGVVLFLATSALRSLNIGRYGDLSYGIYLYHFPLIQLLVHLGVFQASPWAGFAATFALTLLAAYASWHLVEKPLLRRSSHYVTAAGAGPAKR